MGCGAYNLPDEKRVDSLVPIPDNILLSLKSLIEMENKSKIIPGFLFAIPEDGEKMNWYFFMTLKENITKDMIEKKEAVKLYYDNKRKFITIKIDSEERIIKDLTDIGINLIVIEILDDEIKHYDDNEVMNTFEKEYFLSIMKQHDDFQELKNEEIDLIYSENGETRYSKGKIEKIETNEFIYSSNLKLNSPGNPIFFSNSMEVIGIQKSKNCAYFLGPIRYYLKKYIIKRELEGRMEEFETKKEKEKEEETEMRGKKEGDKIIYENGDYFIEQENSGKKLGKGILYDKKGNIKYEGDFINDKYEGKGRFNEEYGYYYW